MKAGNNAEKWLFHAYNEWFLKRPGKHFIGGEDEPSSTKIIVDKMRTASENPDQIGNAWELFQRLRSRYETTNGDLAADAYLECAIAAYRIGNIHLAEESIRAAIEKYGNDSHKKAIANWIHGCIQWQLAGHEDDALVSWEQARNTFKALQRGPKPGLTKEWYVARESETTTAINSAADSNKPPDPVGIVENLGANKPPQTSHVMRTWQILGDIPAGFSRRGLFSGEGNVEVERVTINNEHYRIVSLIPNEREINIQRNQEYCTLRVIGNSMNSLTPEAIMNGDYVLIKPQETAEPGDIVAAVIDSIDYRCTLKQLLRQGIGYKLKAHSDDPIFEKPEARREFTQLGSGFSIRGIAIAVFKRMED